jgi:hypothetical protein
MQKKIFAGGRQRNPAQSAIEQEDPNGLFQIPYLQGNCRWRQVQLLGGARETQVLGDAGKDPKLAQTHI